jgi:hypothetical protein
MPMVISPIATPARLMSLGLDDGSHASIHYFFHAGASKRKRKDVRDPNFMLLLTCAFPRHSAMGVRKIKSKEKLVRREVAGRIIVELPYQKFAELIVSHEINSAPPKLRLSRYRVFVSDCYTQHAKSQFCGRGVRHLRRCCTPRHIHEPMA